MQARKAAGVALAAGACALGLWFASSTPYAARNAQATRVAARDAQGTRVGPPTIAVDALPATNAQRGIPFALTRSVAEAAVREGVLRIAIADQRGFDVAIERDTHDGFGNWQVIGRVQTRLGPQAMVATFGKRAVFAVLPLPDGRTLEVTTDHGATTIAEAGGLVPEGMQGLAANNDAFDVREIPAAKVHDIATTDASTRVQLPTLRTDGLQALAAEATGEVTINVLGLYGPDLIAQLGDEESARTEVAHMLAVANQAHVDSGSRIRLALAGTLAISNPYDANTTALYGIQNTSHNVGMPFPVEAGRWIASADLVFLARPRGAVDATCGASFRIAESTGRNTLKRAFAFAVANVAPCSPYALSHELGHLLGNAHDRDTEGYDNQDVVRHGVLPYASGYRQFGSPAFATVMADPSGLPTLNVFSSPFSSACGAPCGIAEEADEVRSMNSIAAEIADFAGAPDTVTFGNAAGFEPLAGENSRWIVAWANYNAPMFPQGFAGFDVAVVGGTATQGVDYKLSSAFVNGGGNAAQVFVEVLPDEIVEPDETILLRITSRNGWPIDKDTATITILDDDPRPVIRGAVRFDGVSKPSGPFNLQARAGNGNHFDDGGMVVQVASPDYAFAFPVVRGTSPYLTFDNACCSARYAVPVWLTDVRGDLTRDVTFRAAYHVLLRGIDSGKQFIDIGQGPPVEYSGGGYIDRMVPGGARVTFYDRNQQGTVAGFFDDVRQNIDATFAYTPTTKVLVSAPKSVREGDAGVRRVRFDLKVLTTILAPIESITLDWRTRSGTATEGRDFVAASGTLVIPAEAIASSYYTDPRAASLYVDILGDTLPESAEWLELELTPATEGVEAVPARTRLTLRDDDHRTSTPLPAEKL